MKVEDHTLKRHIYYVTVCEQYERNLQWVSEICSENMKRQADMDGWTYRPPYFITPLTSLGGGKNDPTGFQKNIYL